ncbi:hypothetical protein GCM10009678_19260 [Actinomadura kijaniata]
MPGRDVRVDGRVLGLAAGDGLRLGVGEHPVARPGGRAGDQALGGDEQDAVVGSHTLGVSVSALMEELPEGRVRVADADAAAPL